MALRDAAAMLWERTDLRPADVDVAELYDGFSFIALAWLEALGFCRKGEGGPLRRGRRAHRARRRDPAQHATAASSPAAGCTASASCTRPACSSGAKAARARCRAIREVAVAAAGGGPLGGCMLLTRT